MKDEWWLFVLFTNYCYEREPYSAENTRILY